MRLIFAGTPAFAAVALEAIVAAGHQVALVLTQPDRPSGRGMALRASPVKVIALEAGIEVFQPSSLREEAAQARVATVQADAMIVAAYGLILPQVVLDMPRFGCINIHASLLPRWRGAAPIQRSILAGDLQSGVCIMQMEAGLDTGPVLLSGEVPILVDDTAASLHDRLAELGAKLVCDALDKLPMPGQSQPAAGITYAAKIDKAEAPLDWRQPAVQLSRQIRAFDPFPGATAVWQGNLMKVWRADVLALPATGSVVPGQVLSADSKGIVVACGEAALRLTEVQKAGGKRLSAGQFLSGTPILPDTIFDLSSCA